MFLFCYSAFCLVCQLAIILVGLTLCLIGGFGFESVGRVTTRDALVCLAFGAAMTGTSGGALEQWVQIILFKQHPYPTNTTGILLVLSVVVCAEIGMYLGRLHLKDTTLIQGQEPAT